MKKLLFITMLLGVGYSQSVHLEIQNVNLTEGTLDIYMTNTVTVSAFQFFLSGITIDNINGGVAEEYLDFLNVNNYADCDGGEYDADLGCNLILGVSIDESTIPVGTNQLLLTVSFTDINEDEICFSAIDFVGEVSDSWAGPCFTNNELECFEMEFGDCYENDNNWVYGCTYETATNYNAEATFDDGSCEFLWGDMNHDGTLNVQDIIFLVNAILSGDWF